MVCVAIMRAAAASSKLSDMSRNGKRSRAAGRWLDGDQRRALAYIRVQLRLAYEMNRQLLAEAACRCLIMTC